MAQSIKFKTLSGSVAEIQVEEIIEVNGRPYRDSVDDFEAVKNTLNHHQGQIETLMFLMSGREPDNGCD